MRLMEFSTSVGDSCSGAARESSNTAGQSSHQALNRGGRKLVPVISRRGGARTLRPEKKNCFLISSHQWPHKAHQAQCPVQLPAT
ncbi:hypothetical protein XELAEV_18018384mg [Xenopus laevis]|uniref:Uncharacterized protein n=1 Tax=Xenopus laevis TaxID=8355 RepID=A0A974DEX6_XENLA|nr:hypothetical protein XELAEV_18018384mg [Xenopus laevis]